MKILNLANPENSEIEFEVHSFPDGQQNIKIKDFIYATCISIHSRMNSFKDVELIVCANQALKKYGPEVINLSVPYFLGARSDRAFSNSECHYLRDVICPVINSQGFKNVYVLDAHSNVLEGCLNNFRPSTICYNNFIHCALDDIWGSRTVNEDHLRHAAYLISPDTGANKRSTEIFGKFNNYFQGFIQAIKVRNGNSLTIDMQLPMFRTDYVIVDDICDGGATFIEIAKKIKSSDPVARIYLIVTHGIFSKGVEELRKYFEKIYTTNSVFDIDVASSYVHLLDYKNMKMNSRKLINQFEVF